MCHACDHPQQPTPRGVAHKGDTPRQATPRTAATPDAVKEGTPRGATPATGASPVRGNTPQTSTDGAAAALEATPDRGTENTIFLPAVKTPVPELQAWVLHVIAAVLSQQGAVQSLLLQAPQGQAHLLRVLMHMFAPAPVPEKPAAIAADISDGAQAAAPDGASGAPAKAASPLKPGTGSGANGKAPAASAAPRKSGVGAHEQSGAAVAAGGTTPRKATGSSAGNVATKEFQKVSACAHACGQLEAEHADQGRCRQATINASSLQATSGEPTHVLPICQLTINPVQRGRQNCRLQQVNIQEAHSRGR